MKNVLLGVYRNKGAFEDKEGRKVEFDNMNLVVMNYRGYVGKGINVHGFVPQRGDGNVIVPVLKIPTNRFKYVTGIEVKDILLRFERVYFGQVLDLTIKENEYGREEIVSAEFIGPYPEVYRDRKNSEALQIEEVEEFDDSEELSDEVFNDEYVDISSRVDYGDEREFDESLLEASPEKDFGEIKKKGLFKR